MNQVTYLFNSGFLVELPQMVLLFDYERGALPAFDREKPLYVFASHRHHDHFTPEIFRLFKDREQVAYLLSKDIRLSDRFLERRGISPAVKEQITFFPRASRQTVGPLTVESIPSTDVGVAFLVDAGGTRIYHAGDLNLWLWKEEDDAYNNAMRKADAQAMQRLSGEHVHLAFVPLDPRQEDGFGFGEGMRLFLENVQADAVFPMHFREDASYWPRSRCLREKDPEKWAAVRKIEREGQVFYE